MMYTQVGQQVGRFAMRDDHTMFLFTFADEDPESPGDVQNQKGLLRRRFEASGWECAQILAALDRADDFYFDRVSQIRMDTSQGLWTRGRVTLIGDAASCVSLLAGQGTALAMVAAYVLGRTEPMRRRLCRSFPSLPGVVRAVRSGKAEGSTSIRRFICAKIETQAIPSQSAIQVMAIRWIADLAVGRDLADHITLPTYR